MPEFLSIARDMFESGDVNPYSQEFGLVFRSLQELQVVHHKSTIDLDNIESVFAAFEMAALLGKLGGMQPEDVERLPQAMETLISVTLGHTLRFPINSDKLRLDPMPAYADFADLVHALGRNYRRQLVSGVSILTLNYDPCVDHALQKRGIDYNYCLDNDDYYQGVSLLKLHGSLNWKWCTECKKVVSWDIGKRADLVQLDPGDVDDMGGRGFPLGNLLAGAVELSCGHRGNIEPFIVAPTYSKGPHYGKLTSVWRNAARHLCEAESVFVIGFSLPDTDQFFRYLYGLGTVGPATLRQFWVFDPKEGIGKRYEDLLGLGARKGFLHHRKGFAEALEVISRELVAGARS